VKIRDAHSSELIHAGYTDAIKTVFITSFHNLSSLASTVLGIISLLAPDAVPESLFSVKPTVKLPDHLHFCHDEFQYLYRFGTVRRRSSVHIQTNLDYHRVSEVIDEFVSCAWRREIPPPTRCQHTS
jgi:hypothetical protein